MMMLHLRGRSPRHRTVTMTLLISVMGGPACTGGPWPFRGPTAQVRDPRITELSGIAPASNPGEYWCLNDSGHPPEIYRITAAGAVRQAVVIRGAINVDWEAMTRDDQGRLVIADVGDNLRKRKDYQIYIVPEPAADQDSIDPASVVSFAYADGASRDCEAIFLLAGRFYLVSKDADPRVAAAVFRLDLTGPASAEALLVTHLPTRWPVTDAAFSGQRRELAVLSYAGVTRWAVAEESELGQSPPVHTTMFFGQAEALCHAGDDLLVTNEQGAVWQIPVTALETRPE